MCFM